MQLILSADTVSSYGGKQRKMEEAMEREILVMGAVGCSDCVPTSHIIEYQIDKCATFINALMLTSSVQNQLLAIN